MGVYIKNWSLADWKELLKWAKIGANNAMIGEFTEAEEIPPHGRLIDGDKLAEEQKENVRAYHANLITLDDLAECLLKQSISEDGAPTIIEAEEG